MNCIKLYDCQSLKTSSLEANFIEFDKDLSLPGDEFRSGSIHPITHTMREVKRIFESIGFSSVYGPEIDDDYHNFEALNIPKHHPARDMQDTFYITDNDVLRTHTSNTQIHIMEKQDPPIRVICPGRVYRNEAISIRSYCFAIRSREHRNGCEHCELSARRPY